MKKKADIICYVATLYSLLIYLLYSDDDSIEKTFFVLDSSMPPEIGKRLRNSYTFRKTKNIPLLSTCFNWIRYRFICLTKIPRVDDKVELYIQDHKYPAKVLTNKHSYTLIEDSAGVCSRYFSNSYGKEMLHMRTRWFYPLFERLYGPLFGYHFGCSPQCKRLLLTQEDNHPWLEGKERLFVPKIDGTLWDSFSNKKREKILEIYNLEASDIKALTTRKYLLLTDPVWPDDAPFEEHARVFKEIIKRYPANELVIKTHPRDINYPYESEYPEIPVFRKPIPMELFRLLDIHFQTIITLFSTAATQFDNSLIHWYGTEISPYCFNHYGHINEPKGAKVISL